MSRGPHDDLIVIDALEHSNWDRELFEELRTGGLTAVHATLAIWEDCRTTLDTIGRWHQWFEEHSDIIVHARTAADIEAAKAAGKTGILFGFQNASPLEDDIALVKVFYDLGVRIIQLTYNNQSLIGSGCYEAVDGGISRFGREVIREMNRVGMVIDLSHCGERTTVEAVDLSERPVAVTHANPRFFHDGIRNKSDAVLRALAEREGMFGFSLYPFHIGGRERPQQSVFEMIARVADMIGVDHIGFGTDQSRKWTDADLDWIRSGRWKRGVDFGEGSAANRSWPEWPDWFRTPAEFPNLTQGLVAQGFSREEAAKIMGGNWLRFFREGFEPS